MREAINYEKRASATAAAAARNTETIIARNIENNKQKKAKLMMMVIIIINQKLMNNWVLNFGLQKKKEKGNENILMEILRPNFSNPKTKLKRKREMKWNEGESSLQQHHYGCDDAEQRSFILFSNP